MTHEGSWAELINKSAKSALVCGIGLSIDGDGCFRDHLFQHPNSASGSDGKSNGVAGSGIDFNEVNIVFVVELVLFQVGSKLEHSMKGAVFNGVHDDALQFQTSCHQQGCHEVMA